jgi:hypothetical protein
MTADEFAKALSRLIVEAQEAGLDRKTLLAVIEDTAQAMREAEEE